ncbi:MAG: hypothetical protein LBT92_03940 [Rickettsiales bacterium]|jgi:uncharacterized integral membrane protein|nr:hypothetical protein [Rickettsiales bacterium]
MIGQILSYTLTAALFVLLLVFGVQNAQPMALRFYAYRLTVPTYLFAISALFLGFVAGTVGRRVFGK